MIGNQSKGQPIYAIITVGITHDLGWCKLGVNTQQIQQQINQK